MNSYIKKWLAYLSILAATMFLYVLTVFADEVAHVFTSQNASAPWSSSSIISVDSNLEYINKGNNSSVIGNYFSWYYYDSVLWYFETDFLPNPNENVRVVGSSPLCATGYGYKLWWYAYSSYFGFVDFDYSSDIHVYYCVSDEELHGFAYSESNGFQNFEWISFPIESLGTTPTVAPTSSWAFTNDESGILNPEIEDTSWAPEWNADDSNFTPNTIQTDTFQIDIDKESLFYIIK